MNTSTSLTITLTSSSPSTPPPRPLHLLQLSPIHHFPYTFAYMVWHAPDVVQLVVVIHLQGRGGGVGRVALAGWFIRVQDLLEAGCCYVADNSRVEDVRCAEKRDGV